MLEVLIKLDKGDGKIIAELQQDSPITFAPSQASLWSSPFREPCAKSVQLPPRSQQCRWSCRRKACLPHLDQGQCSLEGWSRCGWRTDLVKRFSKGRRAVTAQVQLATASRATQHVTLSSGVSTFSSIQHNNPLTKAVPSSPGRCRLEWPPKGKTPQRLQP